MKMVNQQLIKDINIKTIYNCIYANDGISRSNLSKITKLSKTTVSALVDELINRSFIYDSGTSETDSVGRKPNSLHIKPNSYYVINVAWVDETINIYLTDITGKHVYEKHMQVTEGDSYISLSRECIYESILTRVSREKILGICVVASAMIDIRHNMFYSTTLRISKSDQSSLIEDLKGAFREFIVILLNDTACYAYAEKIYANVTEPDFAFINFGYGIGATLFIDNEMAGHAGGASTQFGHFSIDPKGKRCICGNRGCLEATMGEQALKERLEKAGHSLILEEFRTVTFENIGFAAQKGDKAAEAVIQSMAGDLAFALSNLISTVNPQLIILGGESKKLGRLFLDEIRKNLQHIGFRKMVDNVNVTYSVLEQDMYLIGAMKYFMDIHYQFSNNASNSFIIG